MLQFGAFIPCRQAIATLGSALPLQQLCCQLGLQEALAQERCLWAFQEPPEDEKEQKPDRIMLPVEWMCFQSFYFTLCSLNWGSQRWVGFPAAAPSDPGDPSARQEHSCCCVEVSTKGPQESKKLQLATSQ